MTDSPQVSIIMPVKNAGSYLHDCLFSIRGQTFSFWELVVVNDHSTDNTQEILQDHADKDDRIRVFQNEGTGIVPALQLAFNQARGRYITRMDGDDRMPDFRLQAMVDCLERLPSKTVVTGRVEYFSNLPVSEGYRDYQNWLNGLIDTESHWDWVYRECVIASPNWMTRKQDFEDIRAFEKLDYPEDYHLVLKWYAHGFEVSGLQQTTLHWREHPHRTSRNSAYYDQSHFFRLKVSFFLNHSLEDSSLVLWGTGDKARLTAQILNEQEEPFIWMDLKPEKHPNGIDGHEISHFNRIEELAAVKLLVAVYPPPPERKKLEAYLNTIGLKMGQDWWYL